MSDLNNKIILITGESSGIGQANPFQHLATDDKYISVHNLFYNTDNYLILNDGILFMFSQIERTDNLQQLCIDFYNLAAKNPTKEGARLFSEKFALLTRTLPPIEFTTFSLNTTDGIGDYYSQIYFTDKLRKLFINYPQVQINHISLVPEDKIPLAIKLMEGTTLKNNVWMYNEKDTYEDFEKNPAAYRNIIIPFTAQKESAHPALQHPVIQHIFSNTQFLFNVSIPMHSFIANLVYMDTYFQYTNGCEFHFYPLLQPSCHIESWEDYGSGFGLTNLPAPPEKYKHPVYLQVPMGIKESEKGLRFIDKIIKAVNTDKLQLARSIKNPALSDVLSSTQNYLETTIFAIGYVKNPYDLIDVISLSLTNNKTGDINIIADANLLNQFLSENRLDFTGFTHFEIIKDQSSTTGLCLGGIKEKRLLRIIHLADLSQQDKIALYGLADIVASSGDTSISEMYSALLSKNPARRPLPWVTIIKGTLTNEILVKAQEISPAAKDYFEFNWSQTKKSKLRRDKNSSFDFIEAGKQFQTQINASNYQKITQACHEFSEFLYKNRNEHIHFMGLTMKYLFQNLLINNQIDDFIILASQLREQFFGEETLLHMAVKFNKPLAVQALIEKKIANPDVPHPFNRYNLLQLALHYGHHAVLGALNTCKISMHTVDARGNTALDIAITNKDTESILFLMQQNVATAPMVMGLPINANNRDTYNNKTFYLTFTTQAFSPSYILYYKLNDNVKTEFGSIYRNELLEWLGNDEAKIYLCNKLFDSTPDENIIPTELLALYPEITSFLHKKLAIIPDFDLKSAVLHHDYTQVQTLLSSKPDSQSLTP